MKDKSIKNELRWCIRIKECSRCDKKDYCPLKSHKDLLIRQNFIHIDIPRKKVK